MVRIIFTRNPRSRSFLDRVYTIKNPPDMDADIDIGKWICKGYGIGNAPEIWSVYLFCVIFEVPKEDYQIKLAQAQIRKK
jgi:hypothetical protein